MYTSLYSNSPHIHVNDKQSSSYNFSPVSLLSNVRYNSEINNTVSIAVENVNRAKSQLKTTITLAENNSIV
jgi:hypothetical protein